jgi:hypothetical protein
VKKRAPPTPPPSLHPVRLHGRWVRYLLLAESSNDVVRQYLALDCLPCPDDAELDAMRAECVPPKRFRPRDKTHGASTAFLQRVGVRELFQPGDDVEQALTILRRPRSREAAESALLVGTPEAVVAEIMSLHLRHKVTPQAVTTYRRTFFDTSSVARGQLKVLVEEHVRLVLKRAASGIDAEAAAVRGVVSDARSVACTLPTGTLSLRVVLLALGLPTGKQELGVVIGQLENLAVLRSGEALLANGPDADRRAEAFVGVVQKLLAIREQVVVPDALLQKKLATISLRTDGTPIVTAAQLRAQGDEVTVDTMPIYPGEADFTRDVEEEQASAS